MKQKRKQVANMASYKLTPMTIGHVQTIKEITKLLQFVEILLPCNDVKGPKRNLTAGYRRQPKINKRQQNDISPRRGKEQSSTGKDTTSAKYFRKARGKALVFLDMARKESKLCTSSDDMQ